jgi:hypothetical protein
MAAGWYDIGVEPEQRWLFPGRSRHQPLTTRQFGRLFKEAVKAAGLRKTLSLHSLRHSFQKPVQMQTFTEMVRQTRRHHYDNGLRSRSDQICRLSRANEPNGTSLNKRSAPSASTRPWHPRRYGRDSRMGAAYPYDLRTSGSGEKTS